MSSICLFIILFSSNVAIAQEGVSHSTSHPTGPPTSNPNQNNNHVPDGLTFNKGLTKAREITASKTQFKMFATTRNPNYLWGDKNYSVQNDLVLSSIVEYNDFNTNNLYESTELIQSLDFNNIVYWNFSQEIVTNIDLTFSLYTNKINQTNFDQTELNFTQKISSQDNFMKFDIEITNWPWVSAYDRLAVIFNFMVNNTGKAQSISLHQEDLNTKSDHSTGLFVSNENNQTVGYFLTSENAIKGPTKTPITVNNQFNIIKKNNSALFILNYPFFGSYLYHDPIIGSNGDTFFTQLYTVLVEQSGLLIITSVLTVVSLIAIFVMRRKRN